MRPINFKSRVFIVRSILACVYLGLIVLMVVSGRQHTVLIDNADAPDGSYTAIEGMAVQVNKLESSEYYPGDRDKAVVQGQRHKIKVELFMEGRTEERAFRVPFGQDMVIIYVPKLLAGQEPWLEPFSINQQQQSTAAEDQGNQSMQFGGDTPEDGPPPVELIQ
jgi:hypothetical protein